MDVVGAILRGRRLAEARMSDTVTVRRVASTTTDPMTGVDTPTLVTVYTGKARVQTYEAQEYTPEAGGHTFTVQRYALHIPVGSYRPEIGDLATVDAAPLDPYLVGRALRVVALLHKSQATAYRLGVTDEVA